MKKYRVVIRAFTCRRDVAPMEILKRLLERRGCEVMLANTRNFDKILKFWKPHAIVVNTISGVMVKEQYPDAKIIFFSGEGFHGPNDPHVQIWKDNPQYYKNTDMVLLWGDAIKQQCVDGFADDKDLSKLHVVGNPKLDLMNFLPETLKNNKKNSVGIICRFPKLNDHLGRSVMHFLGTDFQLEETIVQAKTATTMLNVIKALLEKTDLNISIRPHPHEQIESYITDVEHWFGNKYKNRIEIDTSLFIPKWIAEQKAIISPTSTSYLEAYLLNVPVVNIDHLSDIVSYNKDYIAFTKEWQEAAILPKSVEELINILHDDKKLQVKSNPIIEEQLDAYCGGGDKNSANLNAAEVIMDYLKKSSFEDKKHLPYKVMDFIDELSFRRVMWKNPLHQNFCYRRGYHDIPHYVNDIIDNIEKNAVIRE
ncbi:MAG: hypothetical protein COA45_04215 [Zetaproteobacteria bacterium]|nr:MAG: hypothetical protein COA45_04215 [Zetaproteobacteria bacterium]